ncbi:MAG: hypothetical protein MUC87_11700 [Bacteroidia bacterium]|jgi:hypothetical protein|nr:hypothetical protein [Bacteroidia bacterium]
MKLKTVCIIVVAWLMLFAAKLHAQKESLFFHSIGFSLLSGVVAPPAQPVQSVISIYQRSTQGGDPVFLRTETVNRLLSDPGLIIFSATYNLRWNFLEINKHKSFSLSTAPTFGITWFYLLGDVGHFSAPLLVDYNFGYKATRFYDREYGGHIGLGWQFLGTSLIKGDANNTLISEYGAQYWAMLVFRAGFRAHDWFFDLYFSAIRIQNTPGGFLTEADLAGDFQSSDFSNKGHNEPEFVPLGLEGNGTYEDIFELRRGMQEKVYSSFYFKIVFGFHLSDGRGSKKLRQEYETKMKRELEMKKRTEKYAFR